MKPEHNVTSSPGSTLQARTGPRHGEIFEQSATTRALFCQEIAEAIFSHLSLNPEILSRVQKDYLREHHNKAEQHERRRTLTSAARVSKYISEVSLPVLWAQQNGFDRLFRLLPQYTSSWDRGDVRACTPGLSCPFYGADEAFYAI